MINEHFFQYCQKIVLFNESKTAVLLAQRKGEQDYDGIYSFIGGKMETSDKDFIDGIRREKNEEIGKVAKIKVCPSFSINALFKKSDGSTVILPHYAAIYVDGDINLSDEYSNYKWIDLDELINFQPVIDTVPKITEEFIRLLPFLKDKDFVGV